MRDGGFYRDLLRDAAQRFPSYPEGRYRGRGIVVCAGGLSYLGNAFVCMKLLREQTDLPIELFYAGADEMPASLPRLLEVDFAPITVRDITEPALQTDPALRMEPALMGTYPFLALRSFRGFQVKPFAILHSSFEEVFYVDSDNMPIQSPVPLFESEEYLRTGAVFWPDLASTRSTSEELFEVFGITSEELKSGLEFETGQIVLDKRRCWSALLTVCLANSDVEDFREYCYRHTLGDKDTFRLAFEFARQPYRLVPYPSRGVGNLLLFIPVPLTELRLWIQHDLGSYFATGMLQYDLAGQPLFIHKTVSDWDLWRDYRNLGFVEEPHGGTRWLPLLSEWEERGYAYLDEFKRRYMPAFARDLPREFQGIAARAIIRMLDVVASAQRLLGRSSPIRGPMRPQRLASIPHGPPAAARILETGSPVVWTWLATVITTLTVQRGVGLDWPSEGLLASSAALPALLVATVPGRLRRWAMVVIVGLVAILAAANTAHYRVFGSYIPLRSFAAFREGWGQRGYALDLLGTGDLVPALVFLATLVVALLLRSPPPRLAARWHHGAAVVVCLLGLVPAVRWALVVAPGDNEPYSGGFLYNHIVDVRRVLDERQIGQTPAPEQLERVLHLTAGRSRASAAPGNGADPWRGIASGSNVLLIQVESLNGWVMEAEVGGEPVAPVLRSLAKRGILFTDVFDQTHEGRSSDADQLIMASQHPLARDAVSMVRPGLDMEAVPDVLRKQGYATFAALAVVGGFFNAAERHAHYGIQSSLFRTDLEPGDSIGFGLSDRSVFRQATGTLTRMPEPWLGYLTTLTMHGPHSAVPPSLRTIPLGALEGTPLGNYALKVHYTDGAIGMLLDSLDASGKLAHTTVVVFGDHTDRVGFDMAWVHRLMSVGSLAQDAQALFLDRVPLLIAPPPGTELPDGPPARVSTVGGLLDLGPTLLHLLGLEPPMWFLGRSLLSPGPSMAAQASGEVVGDGLMWTGANCYTFPGGEARAEGACEAIRAQAREQLEVSWLITLYGLSASPDSGGASAR